MPGPLALFLLITTQHPDTSSYRDSTVSALIAHARARHARQDSLLHDYQAQARVRLEAVASRSRFSRAVPLLAHETVARVSWQVPNDLKIEVQGVRSAVPMLRMLEAMGAEIGHEEADGQVRQELETEAWLDRPWFAPRALGDSIRLMGVPELGALHPLAPGAEAYYRYAITDSVVLETPGRTVRAIGVRVKPKSNGPSLVAGDMWLDADQGDLVRLRALFLGEYLWNTPDYQVPGDSARARRENRRVARYLTAEVDLEYALHESRFWMPYRQGVVVTLRVPWLLNVTIPFRAVTRFSDYVVNRGVPLRFGIAEADLPEVGKGRSVRRCLTCAAGDSTHRRSLDRTGYDRAGRWGEGRWEVTVPPADSLGVYPWSEPLAALEPADERWLRQTGIELAKLSETLPDEWVGRPRFGIAWERAVDLFQFNRVQGPSLGAGFRLQAGGPFLVLLGTARLGLTDKRPTGSLRWRYDGPEARVDMLAYRALSASEPWTPGRFANSLNAVFAGHDDADYFLSSGGGFEVEPNSSPLAHTTLGLFLEHQGSVARAATSSINDALGGDGRFPPNPAVATGDYLRLSVSRRDALGPLSLRTHGEALVGAGPVAARLWVGTTYLLWPAHRGVTIGATAGTVVGDALPQLLLRVGGLATVRGYDYGTRQGRSAWTGQLDVNLLRRALVMPVVFADAGDVFPTVRPLVSAGLGIRILGGVLRLDLSKGLNPAVPVRVDLTSRLAR